MEIPKIHLSSREFFVFDVLRMDKLQNRVAEKVPIVAVIETPSHLVQIGRKVLCADLMPRTHDAAPS